MTTSSKSGNKTILWLRNDLRLHDNPVFDWVANNKKTAGEVVPIFCFDPEMYT